MLSCPDTAGLYWGGLCRLLKRFYARTCRGEPLVEAKKINPPCFDGLSWMGSRSRVPSRGKTRFLLVLLFCVRKLGVRSRIMLESFLDFIYKRLMAMILRVRVIIPTLACTASFSRDTHLGRIFWPLYNLLGRADCGTQRSVRALKTRTVQKHFSRWLFYPYR